MLPSSVPLQKPRIRYYKKNGCRRQNISPTIIQYPKNCKYTSKSISLHVDDKDGIQNSQDDITDDNTVEGISQQNDEKDERAKIFLRFSPLVGGPPFLPIHVEVMILDIVAPSSPSVQYDAANNENNMDEEMTIFLHRLDFLPQDPTNPENIIKLTTLSSVPGNTRHRILTTQPMASFSQAMIENDDAFVKEKQKEDTTTIMSTSVKRISSLLGTSSDKVYASKRSVRDDDDGQMSSVSGNSFTIYLGSLPFTRLPCPSTPNAPSQDVKMMPNDYESKLPAPLEQFLEQRKGSELNLLKNNCYSFAWDTLQTLIQSQGPLTQ